LLHKFDKNILESVNKNLFVVYFKYQTRSCESNVRDDKPNWYCEGWGWHEFI